MFYRPLFLFSLLFFVFIPGGDLWGAPIVKREKCAICHIYDSPFFDRSMEEKGKLDRKRDLDFCLSCHNGSVVDSREKLLLGYQHPDVSFAVSSGEEGEKRETGGCAACHTPHTKIGWRGYAGTDVSLYTGGDRVCVSCHAETSFPKNKGNHTYGEKRACLTCHTLHGAATKSLLKDRYAETCRGCHDSITRAGMEGKGHAVGRIKKKPVIFTGRDSFKHREDVNLECNVCHDLHGSQVEMKLLIRSPSELCDNCHRGNLGADESQPNNGNHPRSASCTDCHVVHFSDQDRAGKGMKIQDIDPAKACSACHAEKVGNVEDRWNHITGKVGGEDKICFECHSMHRGIVGSANLMSDGDVMCIDCHRKENSLNEQTARPMSHPLFEVISDSTKLEKLSALGGKTGKFGEIICRSCHTVHGAKKKKLLLADYGEMCGSCHEENEVLHGERKYACTECHYVHGIEADTKGEDDDENLLKQVCLKCHGLEMGHVSKISENEIFNRSELPLFDRRGKRVMRGTMSCPTCHDPHGNSGRANFLRLPYYGSTFLCVSCHPKKENISLTPHDLRSLFSESLCEPCHSPHHGEGELMWAFVAGERDNSIKYCGSCHFEGEMASAIRYGQGHPVNVIPQNKEGIPFKYFDLHWNENELGMIACPTCHDVHGENLSLSSVAREGLLRLTYQFGEQSGHIERENFCVSCHVDKKDMMGGFHGNIACESCHNPHKDLSYPDGSLEISWFCLRCHGDAPPKDAAVFALVGKEMEGRYIPGSPFGLYDARGRSSPEGRISCPSCHDVHSGNKKLADSFKEPTEDETCYRCHPEKKGIERSQHDFSDGGGRGCRKCHGMCTEDLHETEVEQIVEELNANPADGKCLFCHDQPEGRGFSLFHPKNVKKVSSTYGAQVRLESTMKMVSKGAGEGPPEFPLFSDKGVGGYSGTLGCLTCHDPHRGNRIDRVKKGFLRDDTGYYVAAICTPCHESDAERRLREFHSTRRKEE